MKKTNEWKNEQAIMQALAMSSQKEDLVVRAVLLKSEAFKKCKLDFSSSEFRFKILKINNNIQIYFFPAGSLSS